MSTLDEVERRGESDPVERARPMAMSPGPLRFAVLSGGGSVAADAGAALRGGDSASPGAGRGSTSWHPASWALRGRRGPGTRPEPPRPAA